MNFLNSFPLLNNDINEIGYIAYHGQINHEFASIRNQSHNM